MEKWIIVMRFPAANKATAVAKAVEMMETGELPAEAECHPALVLSQEAQLTHAEAAAMVGCILVQPKKGK